MAEPIIVEVVYATPEKQKIIALQVAAGTTAIQAIEQSGIHQEFPGMQLDEKALGIFSRKIASDTVLSAGDRVEIYRPLIADPKEVRRQRAEQQGK
ncbi:MAG TPA: RnfH family protein [Xanthomonadales bacterium]|nr:RnfH family protein [Xanthomonadales bacterium]